MDKETIANTLDDCYWDGYQKAKIIAAVINDLERDGYNFKRIDLDDLRLIVKIACRMQVEKIAEEFGVDAKCIGMEAVC